MFKCFVFFASHLLACMAIVSVQNSADAQDQPAIATDAAVAGQADAEFNAFVDGLRTNEQFNDLVSSLATEQASLFIRDELTVEAWEFMNPAANPSLMHYNELDPESVNLGDGTRIPFTGFIFRSALTGSAVSRYDTEFVGAGAAFNPGTITGDSPQAGFFDMTNGSANLVLDLEKQTVFTAGKNQLQAQAILDADLRTDGTTGSEFQIRNVFARIKTSQQIQVLAGQYWTTWGDEGAIPQSISPETATAANIFARVPQMRLAVPAGSNWLAMLALQKPLTGGIDPTDPRDITGMPASPNTALQRWPDLAMRMHYYDDDKYSTFSVGTIVRGVGIETEEGTEHIRTGWGVTTNARMKLDECGRHAVQMGVVGGRGIAVDMFGLSANQVAAGSVTPNSFNLRDSYGAYVGYTHRLYDNLRSNAAYGYSRVDGLQGISARTTQNAWVNLICNINDVFSVGLEYAWGENETNSSGPDNHRFVFALQLKPDVETEDEKKARRQRMSKRYRNPLPPALQPRKDILGQPGENASNQNPMFQQIVPDQGDSRASKFRRL